jgi:SAM-dependent methyltransferase
VLTTELLVFVLANLPRPPARVLEVGAGRGELARALDGAGYDVVAVDPESQDEGIVAVALLDLDEPPRSFDAAVAVVSLHHVQPLRESCRRLGELVRPSGRLVVDEFDVERFDERAAAWWLRERQALGHDHGETPRDRVDELRAEVHPLAEILQALAPDFDCGEPVRGSYLHRWALDESLRTAEEALVAQGALPAVGVRLVARRSS